MSDQGISPIAVLDGLVAALPNSYPATLFISFLVGAGAALLLAGILFLLLGLSFMSVIIEGGEIKGQKKDKQKLETVGSPGRVRIYPGQVVVFHKYGKITRAAGLGTILLKRGENIKAIIPLGNKAGVQEIGNVLTKDRIALTLKVAHGAGIELVSGTKKRLEDMKDKVARDENALELLKREVHQAIQTDKLDAIRRHLAEMEAQEEPDQETIDLLKKYKDAFEQLEKDKKTVTQLQKIVDGGKTVGDEHNQCYADIAKLVAAKAPDPWGATKGGVGVNLRDIFMANEFEDLFEIEGEAEDLKAKIDQRKIAEIEKFVLDKVKGGKLADGIVLNFVDISQIYFPKRIPIDLENRARTKPSEISAEDTLNFFYEKTEKQGAEETMPDPYSITWSLMVLEKATEFLFNQAGELLKERREKRKKTAETSASPPSETDERPISDSKTLMTTLEEQLSHLEKRAALATSRMEIRKVDSLIKQLEDYHRNKLMYEEEAAKLPGVDDRIAIQRRIEDIDNQIVQKADEMRRHLEQLSQRKIHIPALDE